MWKDWKSIVLPLLGKPLNEDPYAHEYGSPIIPRPPYCSPRTVRNKNRHIKLGQAAKRQSALLGKTFTLRVEDVASISGSGSFLLDEPNTNGNSPASVLVDAVTMPIVESEDEDISPLFSRLAT